MGHQIGVTVISKPALLPLPRRIYFLSAWLFLASIYGWLRLILSLIHWNEYAALGVTPGVWYLSLTGALSGLVYTLCGITALLPADKWKKISLGFLAAGLLIHWLDRICFARSVEAQTSLPFSLAFATLLTMAAIFLLYQDKIRSFRSNG